MNTFNFVASLSSIVGLLVSIYTLYKVANLPAALKQHSRGRHLSELIDKIDRLPASKRALPESTACEAEFIIFSVRTYDVSKPPFRHRKLKTLLSKLEEEVKGTKRRELIQNQLRLLRDEITIR